MTRPNNFPRLTQEQALARQNFRCGSCGEHISRIGSEGRHTHYFGEGAQAHHIRHVKLGGTAALDNCVVLCWSCHYTVHEGGKYRTGTVSGQASDYPHLRG